MDRLRAYYTGGYKNSMYIIHLVISDGDLNINTGLDVNVGDLTHNLSGGVDVDNTLVDAHLEAIVRVGTLTARRLTGHDAENLGGHTNRASDLKAALKSTILEVTAHLLQSGHVSGGEGDADLGHGSLDGIDGLLLDRGSGHFNLEEELKDILDIIK